MSEITTFDWCNNLKDPEDYDLIQIPVPPKNIVYRPRGTQYIEKRGQVNISLIHPEIYLGPI